METIKEYEINGYKYRIEFSDFRPERPHDPVIFVMREDIPDEPLMLVHLNPDNECSDDPVVPFLRGTVEL